MNQKALFLDLDDTLLTTDKQISAGNRAAVQAALDAGHQVIITTGRPTAGALPQAEALGLMREGGYLLSFNGGIVYDLYHRCNVTRVQVPWHIVSAVFAEGMRRGIHVQTYGPWDVVTVPRFDDEDIRWYTQRMGLTFSIAADLPAVLPEPPVKLLLIDRTQPERLNDIRAWIDQQFGDVVDTFFSCDVFVEVVPKGINKGAALLALSARLGIAPENTVACGDAENDLTMLRAAGVGVCVCNGTEAAKAAADYITQHDNNHDAIAEVIERFF